ncbi:hypothetical protein BC834DRAFT_331803 [Gloeopeniophorella convolvens]|nr:hypothetical protein BC834DRAFT_331803 [Gloeopeniophorella convolvens]
MCTPLQSHARAQRATQHWTTTMVHDYIVVSAAPGARCAAASLHIVCARANCLSMHAYIRPPGVCGYAFICAGLRVGCGLRVRVMHGGCLYARVCRQRQGPSCVSMARPRWGGTVCAPRFCCQASSGCVGERGAQGAGVHGCGRRQGTVPAEEE